MRVVEIAELIGGTVEGDGDREVTRVGKIEGAGPSEISFIGSPKYAKYADRTSAGALIVDREYIVTRPEIAYIRVDDPYRAFLQILKIFSPPPERPNEGVHSTAVVADDVVLGEGVTVGAFAVIGSGSSIGARTIIGSHTSIGSDVTIGEDTIVHTHVSIYRRAIIGNRVTIHSGAVLGADGFGFLPRPEGGWDKIPQVGNVVLEDDVEIGANSTIDCATLGETRIQSGVKIDNLCHIAHNVVVGRNTAIAAQTGISGSTRIGERNLIAGQAGIVGHIETAADVIIEPQSGVSKAIRKPGRYFGHPAKEHSQALRQEGALRQLPDLLQEIRAMRDRIAQLEQSLGIETGDAVE
jgi:UDP-3-O-[3-hydroxymyristoyl] glucosamine N-acyltransferase